MGSFSREEVKGENKKKKGNVLVLKSITRFMIGVLEYDEDLFSDVYRVKQGGPLDLGWTTEDWEYTENLLDLAGTNSAKDYRFRRESFNINLLT